MKVLVFLLIPLISAAQLKPASCVHSSGAQLVSDAILAAVGACNCQMAPVFISRFPKCDEGVFEIELEDDFDGDSLDLGKWQNCPWGQGALDGAQGMGITLLENVSVSEGICRISVKKETVTKRTINYKEDDEIMSDGRPNLREFYYTRASVFSIQKFLYGKYEIRCKMPAGNGFWPAFWNYGGIRGNEIDVFDGYRGPTDLITMVGHDFDGNNKNSNCAISQKGFDFTKWHTFTCVFDYDKIKFYVDDRLVRITHRVITATGKGINCGDNVEPGNYFQLKGYPIEPMHIIFGMGVISDNGPGGSTPVDETTPFPGVLEVDYVRYWKKVPEDLLISPIPTTGNISIRTRVSEIERVEIYSLDGFLLYVQDFHSNAITLDLVNFETGIYLISVTYGDRKKTSKIIKTAH